MEVTNVKSKETYEIARYFLLGQNVGSAPLFDGLCAMCGVLLHGTAGHNSALSNKEIGPPMDRDGTLLTNEDGTPKTDAQPPCLLRSQIKKSILSIAVLRNYL